MGINTVKLGKTGLNVSELALGTARFGSQRSDGEKEISRDQAHRLLDRYAEAGGNFIDMADVYGGGRAEEYVGDWLGEQDRDKFILASKIYWPTREDDPNAQGLNRKHLRTQIDNILNRLGTDYVDLLYIHRWDNETPVAEFMRTLNGFVNDGRVHYLGASNRDPNAWQVVKANEIAKREGWEPFTNTQIIVNLVDRQIEPEYLPMVESYGLGLMPFSPLAGGFLTGKYERDESPPEGSRGAHEDRFREMYLTDENFDVLDTVREVADEYNASVVQVSLAWLLQHPAVTAPVIGPRTVDQLEANIDATDVDLSEDAFERLSEATSVPY
ncbi:aldo/keto reductase [Natronosalvus rutilus]|uniref:Aldo/keto reductase n=1 Tax=Natronosalvus rutilus TaxID=2953753 RepID=A0A9E7NF21_9EURY|nr:aldo/keto reductase [Natronosalvus rutilus]UTF55683.1 aldo/keto reductase [Natronosalvus rutilus]